MNNSTEPTTTESEKKKAPPRKKLSSFTSTYNPELAKAGEAIVITPPVEEEQKAQATTTQETPTIAPAQEIQTMPAPTTATNIPVVQEVSKPVNQTTVTQEEIRPGRKKRTDIRTKKGVYLQPATAKWLDRNAFENEREISDVTNDALELLRQVTALELTAEQAVQILKAAKQQPATK